jgi:hypothetical protein
MLLKIVFIPSLFKPSSSLHRAALAAGPMLPEGGGERLLIETCATLHPVNNQNLQRTEK